MIKLQNIKNAIELDKQNHNLFVADYPKDMLDIRTDDNLNLSISSRDNNDLEYLGVIIYGNTEDVNNITGKYQLWRLE